MSQSLSRKRTKKNSSLRLFRYWYLKIRRQEGSSEAIARGWACGVFAGSFPLFGLQTLIGLLLATLLRGNKFTAAAGTWISNPFTYVPIYYFNFRIGEIILRQQAEFSVDQLESWTQMGLAGFHFMFILFTGCIVVGSALGIAAYFGTLRLTNRWRSLKKQR
ncbi:DUF2062 domain-containing protein [[Leptolyngbya] sp. PCC 7376]|uniref:DUF2062 domain-containing protein n=1 Tax=[Leptolyngbya] sp. PCC 7376 TaxID=111781 RepID=UPI001CEC7685|nr:DUF2062 domain-containing protein [[Leptolyngbya] sp. PCC 7376]